MCFLWTLVLSVTNASGSYDVTLDLEAVESLRRQLSEPPVLESVVTGLSDGGLRGSWITWDLTLNLTSHSAGSGSTLASIQFNG